MIHVIFQLVLLLLFLSLSLSLYIYIYIYIRSPMGVEHPGQRIFGCRSHNAKLFKRIEHSGIR